MSRPVAGQRAASGEHAKLNSAPVLLYIYRGTDRDEAPWTSEKCGTYAGWNDHKRNHETACPPCTAARNQYMREYRLRKGLVKSVKSRPSPALIKLLGGAP